MNALVLASALAFLTADRLSHTPDLSPQFSVGQELVYEGKVLEIRRSPDAQGEDENRLIIRALVLNKTAKGIAEIGCCTIHKSSMESNIATPLDLQDALKFEFDLVSVDSTGRATIGPKHQEIAPPLEGDYAAEFGFFISTPEKSIRPQSKWVLRRPNQPNIRVAVAGYESVTGTRCLALDWEQETQNWQNPDVSTRAWKIRAKIWFDEKSRTVYKVDRKLEVREPGDAAPSLTRHVVYEQATNIRYHGELLQNQMADLRSAIEAQTALQEAIATTDATRASKLRTVKQDLKAAMQRLYSTPYRSAIEVMYKEVELAEDQEPRLASEKTPMHREARLGTRAPHFVVRNVKTGEAISRNSLKGKAALMVFIDPKSALSIESLQTATESVKKESDDQVVVLAVCTQPDEQAEENLRKKVSGDYIVCSGTGTESAYGVAGTPHLVYIDPTGILRINQKGFGPEVQSDLAAGLKKLPSNVAEKKDKSRSFLR